LTLTGIADPTHSATFRLSQNTKIKDLNDPTSLGSVSIFSRIALQSRLTNHQTAWAKLRALRDGAGSEELGRC
jgi:hypothetical protein